MSKSYDRTSGDDSRSRRNSKTAVIAKELSNLFKKKVTDYQVINRLREKYTDRDLVNSIFEAYKERQNYILRKAKKFKQLLLDHYADRQLTETELIRKAKKYQKKVDLSDDEFEMFVALVKHDRTLESQMFALPATKMAQTLGFSQTLLHTADALNVPVEEESVVQDILRMYGETKSLHSQVVLQSLTYKECAPEALNGKVCRDKHNFYSFVHPVVAALFLPKVKLLEEHMLIANFGYIIHCKKHGLPIMTLPDFELYWDLIRDPNDHVCDSESAIKDLRNRFYLQTKLWDSVLNLRQGKYYQDNLNDFLAAIDQCRSNIYDAPDLTYVKDEGAILRRILGAFSLRPTLVVTRRLWGMLGTTAPFLPTGYYGAQGIVSPPITVPMVTLRLPLKSGVAGTVPRVNIEDALSQPQWFVENNMIIPKVQDIIHSRDVLFFYVGRRYKHISISRLSTPYNFTSLPMTVAGWERLNDINVGYQPVMNILDDKYSLKSVVTIDSTEVTVSAPDCKDTKKNLIVGSNAIVFCEHTVPSVLTGPQPAPAPGVPAPPAVLPGTKTVHRYDPLGAALGSAGRLAAALGPAKQTVPVQNITGDPTLTNTIETKGTIFMYVKTN